MVVETLAVTQTVVVNVAASDTPDAEEKEEEE